MRLIRWLLFVDHADHNFVVIIDMLGSYCTDASDSDAHRERVSVDPISNSVF